MVSGPDFFPDQRWRRKHPEAPWVTPDEFIGGVARRIESQCRNDWTAVPVMRSVGFKWKAEHTMSTLTSLGGKAGAALNTSIADKITALQNLYTHLHKGSIGTGIGRVPINGDISKLPAAFGLSPLERKLARTACHLAQKLPGTQQLRRVMGHRQFGARVVYGDCIFVTISPNEQHSALTLRLTRYRQNDPSVLHGEDWRRRVAGANAPRLEEEAISDLPEYDLRRAAAAQDPYAVIEAYKVEIQCRLMLLLGVRFCPDCPRCNNGPMGCQDKFGSNMRPGGGVLGGIPAVGGGTEHQGYGTPHLHLEIHVASIYQYSTLEEVVGKFQQGLFTFQQWKQYNEWLHFQDIFDQHEKDRMASKLEEQWHARFASKDNDDMSVTATYLVQEANLQKPGVQTVANTACVPDYIELCKDGQDFKKKYFAHVQRVFNRVQHHMHKRTKKGFIPLKSCQRKTKKPSALCKHDFPKEHLCLPRSVHVCRGIAHKFKLSVSGRRNQLGTLLGKRTDPWQSGTTPSFAAGFGSNTHTLPNWRLPPLATIHDDALCPSRKCRLSAGDDREVKITSKVAQRAQRQCTGYYCGYTFKGQPIGSKFVRLAGNSLNYLEHTLEKKTAGQQWHRITHRILTDLQHRCMRRTAPEEWNLSTNAHEHDVTAAEFVRTFQSIDFNGNQLLRRLEAEKKNSLFCCAKVLPTAKVHQEEADTWLQVFVDLYGFRGHNDKNPGVFLLSPWEFTMHWECVRLPKPKVIP